MNAIIDSTNIKRKISTRDIVAETGMRHGNVLALSRRLIAAGEVKGVECDYVSSQNGQVYKEIIFDFDDAIYVMCGLGRKISVALVSKLYTELEHAKSVALPEPNSYIYTDSERRSVVMRKAGRFSWPAPPPPPPPPHPDALAKLCGETSPRLVGKTASTNGE